MNPRDLNEAHWIEQAQRGDEPAWENLMRLHQEAVFRLAYLLLGDPDDAADVAQESFLRAWHALQRFDPARPLRPWLYKICANLARNRRRAQTGDADAEPGVEGDGDQRTGGVFDSVG